MNSKGQISLEVLIIMSVLTIGALVFGTYYLQTVNSNIRKETLDFDGSRAFGNDTIPTSVCGDDICQSPFEDCVSCLRDCGVCGSECTSAELNPITFSPVGGTYSSSQSVNLSMSGTCTQPTSIFYTTDLSTPTTSSTLYTPGTPITVSTTQTINAIAFLASNTNISGDVNAQTYAISITGCNGTIGTPQFSPVGGNYTSPQNINLSYTDPNCSDFNIHYTLNGTEPTLVSDIFTLPSSVISLAETTTVKAKVFAKNASGQDVNGDTNSQTYTFPTVLCLAGQPGVGTGTIDDPKIICTPDDLNEIRNNLSWHYVLGQDIDLNVSPYNTGNGWELINDFSGILNGNNFEIRNLYSATETEVESISFFGNVLQDANILNLGLVDINIIQKYTNPLDGQKNTAGLAQINRGVIDNCYVTGNIATGYLEISGNHYGQVGGLVYSNAGVIKNSYSDVNILGYIKNAGGFVNYNTGVIESSYSKGKISLDPAYNSGDGLIGGFIYENKGHIFNSYSLMDVNGRSNVGGFVSNNDGTDNGSILYCFAKGVVSGRSNLGGFVSVNKNSAYISFSYSTGDVLLTDNSGYVGGGFVGQNLSESKISNCYSLGNVKRVLGNLHLLGGFGGQDVTIPDTDSISKSYSIGKVINESGTSPANKGFLASGSIVEIDYCYWDTENSEQSQSAGGGTGLTTEQMKNEDNFTEWNFETIWAIDSSGTTNNGYPYLRNNPPR